jgi:DNA repair protein RecN (Recombination protein N)
MNVVDQLKAGEQEELESEFEQLNNVEIIKESIDKSLQFTNEQIGIVQHLKEIKSAIQRIAPFLMIIKRYWIELLVIY